MKPTLFILFFVFIILGCNEPEAIEEIEPTEIELPEEQLQVMDSLNKFYNRSHNGIR